MDLTIHESSCPRGSQPSRERKHCRDMLDRDRTANGASGLFWTCVSAMVRSLKRLGLTMTLSLQVQHARSAQSACGLSH